MWIPVVNSKQEPLMPTTPSRARKWIKSGKATGFWKGHVFCIRLNCITSENKQKIVIGVDTGIKKEAFTIKSHSHTYLNIQTDTINHIHKVVNVRKTLRRNRRYRNCPCRKSRLNRSCLKKDGRIPHSIRARWQWRLNIINGLKKIFPISCIVIEDIKADTNKKGNRLFALLQTGKNWFYGQIPNLIFRCGYNTKKLRETLGLTKSKNKLDNSWNSHCVDSWILANSAVGGNYVDNKQILYIYPIILRRRKLHYIQPEKNNIRKPYGGTISLGLKRGSIVKHKKYGITYVGGTSRNRITLHSIVTGKRISQYIRVEDCKFLTYNTKRGYYSNES